MYLFIYLFIYDATEGILYRLRIKADLIRPLILGSFDPYFTFYSKYRGKSHFIQHRLISHWSEKIEKLISVPGRLFGT